MLAVTLGDFAALARGWDRFHQRPDIIRRYKAITHDQSSKLPANYGTAAAIHIKTYSFLQVSMVLLLVVVYSIFFLKGRAKLKTGWSDFGGQRWKIAACILVFMLSRIAIIGYVDAMSFPGNLRYLMVLYPPLMVLICLLLPPYNAESRKENSGARE